MQRVSMSAQRERTLRDEAVREADDLFSRLGSQAIVLLSKRLVDRSRSAEQRRSDRLTMLAVEKLDRVHRQGGAPAMPMMEKPALFSRAWFAALFGIR